MSKGKIKWFSSAKGYGFATQEDGTDIFVHFSSIVQESGYKTLAENDEITYDVVDTPKGKAAANVKKVVRDTAVTETPAV